MEPWYATREDVMSGTDVKASARTGAQIDADIEASSRTVEALLHRKLYPWSGTRFFDFPDRQTSESYRIWFDQFDLTSLTSILNGDGTAVPIGNVFLDPQDGPPYTSAQLSVGSSAAFTSGSTWQRTISFTGLWGWANTQLAAGTLTAGINTSVLLVPVSDSSLVGVGSLLTVGAERMQVTGKLLTDTTATLGSDLGVSAGQTLIPVSSGALVNVGELVTVGSETMQVVDKTGNTLIVKRAVQGSVLANHASGDAVWAPRSLSVLRAVTGTVAASASMGAAVTAWQPPGPARMLTVAQAIYNNQQRIGGWSASETKAAILNIDNLRSQVVALYGRLRSAVV